MTGPVRVERTQSRGVGSVVLFESNRAHEPSDTRKEELGITEAGLDFEGRYP